MNSIKKLNILQTVSDGISGNKDYHGGIVGFVDSLKSEPEAIHPFYTKTRGREKQLEL